MIDTTAEFSFVLVVSGDPPADMPARLAPLAAAGPKAIIVATASRSATDLPGPRTHPHDSPLQGSPPIRFITGPAPSLLRGALSHAAAVQCTHVLVASLGALPQPSDVTILLDHARKHPADVVIGQRDDDDAPGDPLHQLLLRLETGRRLRAANHAPTVYPRGMLRWLLDHRRGALDDHELLVRAAWAGCELATEPLPRSMHPLVSHDTLRRFITHVRLVGRALTPWPHARYVPKKPRPDARTFWKTVLHSFNPAPVWRELRAGGASRTDIAAACAIGVFISTLPTYGFQTVLAVYVARRLHLNVLAVLTGSHISVPPIGPAIVAVEIWIGHLLLHGASIGFSQVNLFHGHFWSRLRPLLLDWFVGSLVISLLFSSAAYMILSTLFKLVERGEE